MQALAQCRKAVAISMTHEIQPIDSIVDVSQAIALIDPMMSSMAMLRQSNARVRSHYSVMIRSAHSTSDTKIAGLPNFAPQSFRSVSVTPRAREQAPQEKTGMCFATTLSSISLRGGHPTGNMATAVALRMR